MLIWAGTPWRKVSLRTVGWRLRLCHSRLQQRYRTQSKSCRSLCRAGLRLP